MERNLTRRQRNALRREANQLFRDHRKAGKSFDDATDATVDELSKKYGAGLSIDGIAALIDVILKIIEAIANLFSEDAPTDETSGEDAAA